MNQIVSVIILVSLSGCATLSSINNANPGFPIFFSGTRFDANALQSNKIALKKYRVKPPKYPLVDLPFSFVADLFISPLSGGAALYETIFEWVLIQ